MRELSRNRVSQDRLDAIEQALLGETVQPSESRLDAIEKALMGEGAPSAAPAVTERVSSPLPLEPSPAPSVEELKTMEYEGIPVTGRREPMFVPAPVLPVGGAITRPVPAPWSLPTDIAEAAFHLAKGAVGYLPSKAEELIRLGIGTAKGMTPEELEEFAGEAGSWLGPGPSTSTAQVVERALGPIFAFPGEVVRGEKIKTPPGPPSPRAGAFQATYERLQKEARARGEEVPPALISEETSQKIGVWANSIFTTALELYGFKQLHNVFQGVKSKLKIKKRRAKMTREEYEAIAEELRKQAEEKIETKLGEAEQKHREAKNKRDLEEALGERERLQRLREELPKSKEEPPPAAPVEEPTPPPPIEPAAPAAPETPVFLAWKETTNPDKPYVAYYKVGDKILPGITLRGMGLEIPETPPSPLAKAKVKAKVEPEPAAPPEIPAFKTTNEAVEFGKTATPEQIARMKELAEEHRRLAKEAREAGDSDTAMEHAVNAQFLREAVEQPKLPGEAVPEGPKFGKGEPKEKTLVSLEDVKTEAEQLVAEAKDLNEVHYKMQELTTRYEEHPTMGFKDHIERDAYREWGDEIMGKINDARRKAGLVEQTPDAPVEAVIEGKRSSFEDPTGTGGFESRKSAEFYKLGFPEVGRVVENPYAKGKFVFERGGEVTLGSGVAEFQRMYERFAERFRKRAKDEGRKITEAASETLDRGEIVSQRKIKGMLRPPVYRAELEILKEANKLPQTMFHRGFENPIRTFNEAGGEAMLDLTTHPYHAREKGAMILGRKWTKSRRELKRGVTKKELDRIARHAIGKQEFGQEKLEFMGRGMVKELTPKEAEIYDALRARFESHYRQVNNVRKYLGKEPLPYVEDYFTFIRNMSWLERAGFEPMQMPSDILNAHFIKMGSTPFPFEKPRSRTAYRLEMDPFHVLETYENTLARYIQLSPLVAKLREYQATMTDPETGKKFNLMNENPVLATALQSWANAIGGMKSPSFKLPLAIEKGMARVNNNLVASILGANVRSAMIQVTALRNTVVEIGPAYTMRGILSLVDPARRNFALQKSKVLLQRTYDIAVEDALRGIRAGKVGEVQRFGTRLAMKPLQILDMETAKATWQGAYDYAINKKGMTGRRAVNFADDVVTRTQASGMIGDLAPIQRPVVGRFLTLFQTFTINDWDFLVKDVVGVRNRGISSGKAFRKAMSYVAATTLFNILLEDVLHINSPFPTPIRAFKESLERGDEIPSLAWNTAKEFIEPIPMIGAARYGKGPFGPGGELILETVKGISVDPQAPAWWELGGKWVGLPGTAQVGKMTSARKRGETPYGQVVGTYTPPKKKTPSGFGGMGGMGELGGGL